MRTYALDELARSAVDKITSSHKLNKNLWDGLLHSKAYLPRPNSKSRSVFTGLDEVGVSRVPNIADVYGLPKVGMRERSYCTT
jgi:hypothetical protein